MNYAQALEKEVEKLCSTQEKLHNAESEIRTLKSFLTTKTAIVEKRKKELRDTKAKMSELEEKDARRAVILADVLEKTARQYQQQLGALPISRSGKVSPEKRYTIVQTPLQTQELRYYLTDWISVLMSYSICLQVCKCPSHPSRRRTTRARIKQKTNDEELHIGWTRCGFCNSGSTCVHRTNRDKCPQETQSKSKYMSIT